MINKKNSAMKWKIISIFIFRSNYGNEDPGFKNDKMLMNVITAHKIIVPVSNTQPESN
jgi:hypothetical protein